MRSLYVESIHAIMNQWRAVLPPAEVEVLYFINERTTRYDKDTETITLKHFMKGVFSGEGERIIAGLKRNKSTIIKAYQNLEKRGLIQVGKIGKLVPRNTFAINFKKLIQGAYEMAGKLKVGKKHKESEQVTQRDNGGSLRGTKGVTQKTSISTHKVSTDIEEVTDTCRWQDSPSLVEDINAAIHRQQEKQKAKASKAETNFTTQNVLALWKKTMAEHYKGKVIPAVSRKEFAVLRNSYNANTVPVPLSEFMEWAVANWESLRENELRWVKDMPSIPSLRTFGYLYQYFVRAYGEFGTRANKEQERLRRAGSTKRIDQQRAVASEAKAIELERKLADAQREREHFRRLAKEKRKAYRPQQAETKNHEDLGFDEIEEL